MKLDSVAATLMIVAFWAITGIPVMAAPIAEFDPTSFDIGKPIEGEKVKAVFHLKNTGDADLEITKVYAGCGCTEARATESKILPGKSAAVEAVFNTSGYPGKVRKHITVTTNDPVHQAAELRIEGEVIPIAELKPGSYLNLGDLAPGAVSLNDITIIPNIRQPFRLLKVESFGKLVTVLQYDKKKNPAGNYKLKIRVMANNSLGRFFDQLSITTDLPNNPAIRMSVYGNVVSSPAKDNPQ